jgi:hypothetical protein
METSVPMILAMKILVVYTRNTIAMMVANVHMISVTRQLDVTMNLSIAMITLV